ncbi:LPXTG cell wall anchor domain-containing protein [Rathayibacter sp. VKM Ac-2927]|uniref:LPXTG cell wall anchor domain-containing protein n=1 Tax=Rathayibacter sp. VKM Ac-2927 TaxID=2929478 RepID=UPI001FB48960|nr:LPXTG cell wall anchor domain-containing protein [Rathayibacter sp. VKM Ac-2927]MCJ1687043.1 LPXTG cell wall anchor domain-containing protein [Rathayibacter sp. VKM Ac-2927]
MHRRPDSLRPRRCAGTPFTVAASLALTVGLLGSATAAHAAEAPPASPTPTASATVNAAALTATARGELVLKPGEKPASGTPLRWTITVTNTGAVPLDDVTTDLSEGVITLKPGEKHDFIEQDLLTRSILSDGYALMTTHATALTPTGTEITTLVTARFDLPTPTPAPTPTTPAPTPTTPAPTPTTPAPAPTPARGASLSATARGELVLKPGETPTVGTPVRWTVTLTNTGDVPLDEVGDNLVQPGLHLEPGQAREVTWSTTLDEWELSDGFAHIAKFVAGLAPDGTVARTRVDGRIALPSPIPTPAPTPPTPSPTPTTPAPTPTTPAPSPAPTPAEDPTLRATADGEVVLKRGETPKVGTPVRWTITVTNTSDVRVQDITADDTGDLIDLDPGQTGDLKLTTTLSQEDLTNGYTLLDALITGKTPAGTEAITLLESKLTFAAPMPPTPTPTPTPPTPTPTPTPTPPAPTPTPPAPTPTPTTPAPTPVVPTPTPSPSTSAAVVPVTPGSTGSTAKVSSATDTAQRRLASTGYDAASALPAAGILTALGALGVLLGRRRRRHSTAD